MLMLIAYDIGLQDENGQRRLRRISKACLDYGLRVQYSLYECELTPAQWVALKAKLLELYDPERDSLRFYHLGSNSRRKIEHHGSKTAPDTLRDPLIF